MDYWTRDYCSDSRNFQERTKERFAIITSGGFLQSRGRLHCPENEWDSLETHEKLSYCMITTTDVVPSRLFPQSRATKCPKRQRQLAQSPPQPPLLIGGIATSHSNASRVDVHWLLIAAIRNLISRSPNKAQVRWTTAFVLS